jgi:hypothetical protein
MNKNKNGSLVIMILFFTTVFGIIAFSVLRSNSYYILLAREREHYENHYQLADALYNCARTNCAHAIKEYKGAYEYILFEDSWPTKSSEYIGKVWISLKNQQINVQLIHSKKVVIHTSYKI